MYASKMPFQQDNVRLHYLSILIKKHKYQVSIIASHYSIYRIIKGYVFVDAILHYDSCPSIVGAPPINRCTSVACSELTKQAATIKAPPA
jgi:hypothetical protein